MKIFEQNKEFEIINKKLRVLKEKDTKIGDFCKNYHEKRICEFRGSLLSQPLKLGDDGDDSQTQAATQVAKIKEQSIERMEVISAE